MTTFQSLIDILAVNAAELHKTVETLDTGNSLLFDYNETSFSITDKKNGDNLIIPYLGSKAYKQINVTLGGRNIHLNINGSFNDEYTNTNEVYNLDSTAISYIQPNDVNDKLDVIYIGRTN